MLIERYGILELTFSNRSKLTFDNLSFCSLILQKTKIHKKIIIPQSRILLPTNLLIHVFPVQTVDK